MSIMTLLTGFYGDLKCVAKGITRKHWLAHSVASERQTDSQWFCLSDAAKCYMIDVTGVAACVIWEHENMRTM